MATAGSGRTTTRSTASTAAGRVSRAMSGRGVPSTRSGGTARVSSSRWRTSAISSQWAARSPSGHVTAATRTTTPPTKRSFWRVVAGSPGGAWPTGTRPRGPGRRAATQSGGASRRGARRRSRRRRRRRLWAMEAPTKLDRLERVTDLVLVLLETRQPLTLDAIAHQVPGYPSEHAARRQAFERDKRLLRDEGIPVLTAAAARPRAVRVPHRPRVVLPARPRPRARRAGRAPPRRRRRPPRRS